MTLVARFSYRRAVRPRAAASAKSASQIASHVLVATDTSVGAAAAAVAMVVLAVVVQRAFTYPLWQDEVGAARAIVAPSFGGLLRQVTAQENHPPGFYALCWLIHRAGVPVVGLRAVSVLAAFALSFAVVPYTRRLLPLSLSALAGFMVALSWQLEMHGWELRPYALVALLSFLMVVAAERAAEHASLFRLALLAGAVALGVSLHEYFVFTIAAVLLWLVVWRPVAARRAVVAAIAVGLVPLGLWMPRFFEQYRHRHFATLPGFSLRGAIGLYADLFERSIPRGVVGGIAVVTVACLVLVGAARLWRDPQRGRLCVLAAVVPVVSAGLLWRAGPHVFAPRALIGVLPFAAICLAAALTALPRSVARVAAVGVAAVVLAGFARADGRIVPAYDRVAQVLVAQGWRPQEPIVLFGPLYAYLDPLDWYLPGDARLAPAWARSNRCRRVSIVAVGAPARALLRRRGDASKRAGGVAVAAEPWSLRTWHALQARGGTLIATRESPCLTVRWGK